MTKTLFFAAFLALALATPARAQDDAIRDTSVPPEQQQDGFGAAAPAPASVFVRGAPINMRPGAYIGHDSAQAAAQQPGYAEPRATSAAAYNAGLMQARAARVRQMNSVIPSPFPEGFGDYNN